MDTGVPSEALERYIEEQIFTLPGVVHPRDAFSVLLVGSRATGTYTEESDVDVDVVCPREVYELVQSAAFEAGRIKSPDVSLYMLLDCDWRDYFGKKLGRPHFSLIPTDEVERHFRECDDVWLWLWTNAVILHDPGDRFRKIVDAFTGYPHEVLVRKIKYHWMLASYWEIEAYPHHHTSDDDLLPAAMAVVNAVNELYRFFFIVEGRPFPYVEELPRFVSSTKLGRRFGPFLRRIVAIALGRAWADRDVWNRLDEASRLICHGDTSPEACELEDACAQAMRDAGVDEAWVKADFNNIDELLLGKLGPMP